MTSGADGAGEPVRLRVMTYNVHGLRYGLRFGPRRVAPVVADLSPDIACFQEVPTRIRWRTRASELARRSGLYVVCGGRPAVGNLLACSPRVEVLEADERVLSRTAGLPPRGCVTALLSVGGVRFGVVGTHLGLRASERARHAGELRDILGSLRERGAGTLLLAGDLNAEAHADAYAPLREILRDPLADTTGSETYPSTAPTARIDVVLADHDTTVVGTGVPEQIDRATLVRASDHLPAVGEFLLRS